MPQEYDLSRLEPRLSLWEEAFLKEINDFSTKITLVRALLETTQEPRRRIKLRHLFYDFRRTGTYIKPEGCPDFTSLLDLANLRKTLNSVPWHRNRSICQDGYKTTLLIAAGIRILL